jgi:hypothetical protein
MKCPYCQEETPLYEQEALVQRYYCHGSNCDVFWEIFTDGSPYRTFIYFDLPIKELDNKNLVFQIDYTTKTSKVYHRTIRNQLFQLSHIPDWTPKTVAQQVKKLLPFL